MNRIPFRTVLENALALIGQPYDATLTAQLAQATRFANMRFADAWVAGPWPEWTLCEERAFADDWSNATSYAIGDTVYVSATGKYYVSLTANTGANPATSATDWTEQTPSVKTVAYEQTNKWKIDRVFAVTDRNPRQYRNVRSIRYVATDTGITMVDDVVPTTVWMTYIRQAPEYSSRMWSKEGNYAVGDIVMSPAESSEIFPQAGECFQVQVDEYGNNFWALIGFPDILADAVSIGVAADLLRYTGKGELADAMDSRAEIALADKMRKVGMRQQVEVIL